MVVRECGRSSAFARICSNFAPPDSGLKVVYRKIISIPSWAIRALTPQSAAIVNCCAEIVGADHCVNCFSARRSRIALIASDTAPAVEILIKFGASSDGGS